MAKSKEPKKTKEVKDEEAHRLMAEVQAPVPVRMGRPTDYRPEVCFEVVALGAAGKSKAVIAANLGISLRTLYYWMQTHPDFLQAMEQAETLAQCWWEEAGQKGMFMQGFSAAIWSRSMSARFPRDWREQPKQVEHSGKVGSVIELEVKQTINVDNMSLRALDALEEALLIIEGSEDEADEADEESTQSSD